MGKYNREEILIEGLNLLMDYGYSGLGIQHVLKACGIPKGSFYNFFDSKEAFVKEALSLYNERIEGLLMSIDRSDASSYEKIASFFEHANKQFIADDKIRSCPMLNTVADRHEMDSELLEFINEKFKMHKRYLMKWIEEGQNIGGIKSHLNPSDLTDMIYDVYHGVVYRGKYENDQAISQIFVTKTLALILK